MIVEVGILAASPLAIPAQFALMQILSRGRMTKKAMIDKVLKTLANVNTFQNSNLADTVSLLMMQQRFDNLALYFPQQRTTTGSPFYASNLVRQKLHQSP